MLFAVVLVVVVVVAVMSCLSKYPRTLHKTKANILQFKYLISHYNRINVSITYTAYIFVTFKILLSLGVCLMLFYL